MKKKRFLEILKKKLDFLNNDKREKVVKKYDSIIEKRKKKKKETLVVKELNVEKIVKREYFCYRVNKIFLNMRDFIVKVWNKIKEFFIKCFNGIKVGVKFIFGKIKSFFVKCFLCIKKWFKKVFLFFKGLKLFKRRNKSDKGNSKNKNKVKNKKSKKGKKKKEKKKKDKKGKEKDKKKTDKNKEKEQVDEKNVGEVVVVNEPVFRRSLPIRIVNGILVTILSLILFALGVVFFISVIAFLDGVKMYGFIGSVFVLIVLIGFALILINKYLYGKKLLVKRHVITFAVLVLLLGCGVGFTIYDVYKLSEVDNLSEFYTMTSKKDVFSIYDEEFYVKFNKAYSNKYMVKYDNKLVDEVRVEVNYYMNYYDYFTTKKHNEVYISFHKNERNIISSLIEGLKEGYVYNFDELARYEITIYINEKDKDRVLID